MSHLKLDPATRQRLEQAFGASLPDPNELAFEPFLENLRETHPELADELIANLEVEGAELPHQRQGRKAQRREERKHLIHRLLYSETYTGEPSLNKRKLLLVIVAALVTLLPGAFLIDQVTGRAVIAEAQPAETLRAHQPQPALPEPEPSPPPTPWSVPAATEAPPPPPVYTPPPGSSTHDLPPPPGPMTPSIAATPPRQEPVVQSALVIQDAMPARPPEALTIAAAAQGVPAPLTLVAPPPAPNSLATPSNLNHTMAMGSGHIPRQPLSLDRQATASIPAALSLTREDALRQDVVLTIAPADPLHASSSTPHEPLPLTFSPSTEPPHPVTTLPAHAMTFELEPPLRSEGTSAPPLPHVHDPASAVDPKMHSSADQLSSRLHPGARVPAQLATGIILTEGMSVPVVAETPAHSGWCGLTTCPDLTWLGTAKLSQPNRVTIDFQQAILAGTRATVTATAFDEHHRPGLAPSLHEASPTLVQDLLRAAAGGLSDYLEAFAERQTHILSEGTTIIQDAEIPSLDRFLLGRAARLFDIPADQTTLVRVAQLEPGTPLVVLYGVGARH